MAYGRRKLAALDCRAPMGDGPITNRDMLAWFAADERSRCDACGRDSCVSADRAAVRICLACGAVWTADGVRLDVNRRIEAV
jgi:hypothetical protein